MNERLVFLCGHVNWLGLCLWMFSRFPGDLNVLVLSLKGRQWNSRTLVQNVTSFHCRNGDVF